MTFGLQLLGIVGAPRYHARRDPLDLQIPRRIIDIPQSGTEASEIREQGENKRGVTKGRCEQWLRERERQARTRQDNARKETKYAEVNYELIIVMMLLDERGGSLNTGCPY